MKLIWIRHITKILKTYLKAQKLQKQSQLLQSRKHKIRNSLKEINCPL